MSLEEHIALIKLNYSTLANQIKWNYSTIAMEYTCRSQVRNSAGLRRFLLLSFFWIFRWFLSSNERGGGLQRLYRQGTAGRPPRGRQAPLSPAGGRPAPHIAPASRLEGPKWKKKLHKGPVACPMGDRPMSPPADGRPLFLKFFESGIYFWKKN